jgi:ComF family protein
MVMIKPIIDWASRLKAKAMSVGWRVHVRHLGQLTLDALYPPQSFTEGQATQVLTPGLSPEIWGDIRFLDAGMCEGCAVPLEASFGHNICLACQDMPFSFARARAACVYNEASKGLILAYKHADRLDLTPILTAFISRSASDILSEADAILPVPLHPGRLFARRYNQSAELARSLAKRFGKTYLSHDLQRFRATKPQGSGLNRHDNVKAAFRVSTRGQSPIKGKRLVLIDDVMTSGATLEACSKALLAAGALQVDVAVIARALRTMA